MTPKQLQWIAESRPRIAAAALRFRAEPVPPAGLPILPAQDRVERMYADRPTCSGCGANLRRLESLWRPCGACEASPQPLVPEPEAPPVTFGCGCDPEPTGRGGA